MRLMKSARTSFSYQSRSTVNAVGALLCIVGAAGTGVFAYIAFANKSGAAIVFGIGSFLFLLACLTFCLGLIQPFKQELEVTESSLRWTSQRFPKAQKQFVWRDIRSLAIHTLDNTATKIVLTLATGEVIQIPFSHFSCDEDEANSLVQFLKSKHPSIVASVA